MEKVIIIGGGLAGLVVGIRLAEAGISPLLIEKKGYPAHKVCGEYISNEATPFLKASGLYPQEYSPTQVSRFQLSSISGRTSTLPLDLGGFGISRYSFDNFLYQKGCKAGVRFLLHTEVTGVRFADSEFEVQTPGKTFNAHLVIGAYGKRSKLDARMRRPFMQYRSPYAAIKYHILSDHPADIVALHNFPEGYCGVVKVDGDKTNLCYLTHRDNIRKYGQVRQMEEAVLFRNPLLKSLFRNSQFLFDKPEVINEISFRVKSPVENHVLMAGDASGMIAPVCGNGMAMAIHAGLILSDHIIRYFRENRSRAHLEAAYRQQWNDLFAARLRRGRYIQKLFGSPGVSELAVFLAQYGQPIAKAILKSSHGKPFG